VGGGGWGGGVGVMGGGGGVGVFFFNGTATTEIYTLLSYTSESGSGLFTSNYFLTPIPVANLRP
jgi:hypothetical protein